MYMDKRERILDAFQELLREGMAGTASVADIAKKAGIAKGGMYYYFKNKEEALDALTQRQYDSVLSACSKSLEEGKQDAVTKMKLLLYVYRNTAVDSAVDKLLHQTQNAAIHQKSMAHILRGLTPMVTSIFMQGVQEGLFHCDYPEQYAEIVLCVFVFLIDPGVFDWTTEEYRLKLVGVADLLEKGLETPKGTFAFLYENWTKQRLL